MALALNKVTAVKEGSFERKEALENGTYEAVLSAIIDLEIQVNDYDKSNIKLEHQVKVLFEIPEYCIEIDGVSLPLLLSKTIALSAHEKSNFYKLVSALKKTTTLSKDAVLELINTDGAIKELLGKAVVLQVEQYITQHKDQNDQPISRNKIVGYSSLRAAKTQPQPTREPFVFEVAQPDLEIFKDKLSRWTRDTLMTAENNDEFPAELHKAYRDIKEAEQRVPKK